MKTYRAELHVHTVLSPCAEVEMIPPLIVETALDLGINLIAVTDHNSSANVQSVQQAAQGTPLTVLPGVELQTAEDIHCLCLFDQMEQLNSLQEVIWASIPPLKNSPEHFGEQFVVDATGEFIRREDQLLILSTNITLTKAWNIVESLGGLFIPAHVNRKAFGLLETLGFVPTDIQIDCLEISRHLPIAEAVKKFPQLSGYSLIQSGDVHRLDEFLGKNLFHIESPTISEIKLALRNMEGRSLSFY